MVQPTLKAFRSVHEIDPKDEILNAVKGDIEKVHPNGRDVLVAVYTHSQQIKTAGGALWLPKNTGLSETDKHQGIVGLVLKLGPQAEKFMTESGRFGDRIPKVGTWIAFNTVDTFHFIIGERHARLIDADLIRLVVDEPDIVI